jgi:hypothetical protein
VMMNHPAVAAVAADEARREFEVWRSEGGLGA